MRELTAVRVEWEDAYVDCDALDPDTEVPERIMLACGWLIRKTEKHVVIGIEWDETDQQWRSYQVIPTGMVRSIVTMGTVTAGDKQ